MRIYTSYSGGIVTLRERSTRNGFEASWVDIPRWQWLLYRAYRAIAVHVERWEHRLDDEACEAAAMRRMG